VFIISQLQYGTMSCYPSGTDYTEVDMTWVAQQPT